MRNHFSKFIGLCLVAVIGLFATGCDDKSYSDWQDVNDKVWTKRGTENSFFVDNDNYRLFFTPNPNEVFAWQEEGNAIIEEYFVSQPVEEGEVATVLLDSGDIEITREDESQFYLDADEKPSNDLTGNWNVAYIWNETPLSISDAANITFADGGQVSGFGGVNNFSGTYQAANFPKISFGPMAATRVWGPDIEFEQQFLQRLNEVNKVVALDNVAYLYRGSDIFLILEKQ